MDSQTLEVQDIGQRIKIQFLQVKTLEKTGEDTIIITGMC